MNNQSQERYTGMFEAMTVRERGADFHEKYLAVKTAIRFMQNTGVMQCTVANYLIGGWNTWYGFCRPKFSLSPYPEIDFRPLHAIHQYKTREGMWKNAPLPECAYQARTRPFTKTRTIIAASERYYEEKRRGRQ